MHCTNCGNRMNDGARFCASCGAEIRREDGTPSSPGTPASVPAPGRAAVKKPLKGKITDWLMLPAAIVLILLGLGNFALILAGKPIDARVTGIEQVMYLNNDDSTYDSRRYRLDYEFTVDGERYDGSITRIFENGSHIREALQVRYLPFWPHVNAEDGGLPLAGLMVIGAGVLLLAAGIGKKGRSKHRAR